MPNTTEVFVFSSPTCAPCAQMKPIFEELKEEFPSFLWRTVDVGMNPTLVSKLEVTKIPSMVIVHDDKIVGRHHGTEVGHYFRILRAAAVLAK
jgi:thiol-disulfide isomerase/thioredoxin